MHGKIRAKRGGTLAEFGPSLWLFLLFVLLPLLDLLSFCSGVGTTILLSNWSVRQAAACNTFREAQASVRQTEDSLRSFRNFAYMAPSNGATSGVSIRVVVTPIAGGTGQSFDQPGTIPNQPPADPNIPNVPPMNTLNCVYQYVVTAAYDVSPLFNFRGAPFLSGVPALGRPVPITFTSTATVEHPDGLNQ